MKGNPYLFFNGDCAAAFKYYEQHLGGRIESLLTHAETPMSDKMPPGWQEKIIHGRIAVGDTVIMASDAPPPHYHAPQGFSVSLTVADVAEAERIYAALADGGKVNMPLQQTFWAQRFAMLTDRFGIPWMVNCE
jgi:PhnB protein